MTIETEWKAATALRTVHVTFEDERLMWVHLED